MAQCNVKQQLGAAPKLIVAAGESRNEVTGPKEAQKENDNVTYATVIAAGTVNLGNDANISQSLIPHGADKMDVEALRNLHPMRDQTWGESDGETRDTGQSTNANAPSNSLSAWILNDGNFQKDLHPLKTDLLLPKIQISLNKNTLILDEHDYIPISKGWGFSLLGFFAGRFPGKEAVYNLTKRWRTPCRVSFHPKGWIIFRFQTEDEAKQILAAGPYNAFGIPLVLCNLPPEFRFDSSPDLQFKVWVTLPNLPLELWNPSALAKITSVVGTPMEVDHKTIAKHSVAGPKVLVLVDATNQPPESITLRLHNGNSFEQPFHFDCFPFFCTSCRRAGHPASSCRAPDTSNHGTRTTSRSNHHVAADEGGWTKVQHRKKRTGRSTSRQAAARSKSRPLSANHHRSCSRPPEQIWVPVQKDDATQNTIINRNCAAIPPNITNQHIHFASPASCTPQMADELQNLATNRFCALDGLEQHVEAVLEDPPSVTNHKSNNTPAAGLLSRDQERNHGGNKTCTPHTPVPAAAQCTLGVKSPAVTALAVTALTDANQVEVQNCPRENASAPTAHCISGAKVADLDAPTDLDKVDTTPADTCSTEYVRIPDKTRRRHRSVPAVSRAGTAADPRQEFAEFVRDMQDDGQSNPTTKEDLIGSNLVQSNTFSYAQNANNNPLVGKIADRNDKKASNAKAIPPDASKGRSINKKKNQQVHK